VQFTIRGSLHYFLTPFCAAYNQRRLTIGLIRRPIIDYWKKQTRTLRISENINFTNDDVMKYVIGALQ